MSLGFPMRSGVHHTSYATNSGPQNAVLLRCRPLLERAIAMQQAHFQEMKKTETSVFRIADIGCSSGPNCLTNMQFMLDAIAKYYAANDHDKGLAVQSFFCDLPSNDFNTLFQLHHAQFPHSSQHGFFSAAVAGTAYGRLFPASSLHLIFSSCCLQWLSQGVVAQDDLDTFNFPVYLPNVKEIMLAINTVPYLKIQSLEVIEEAIGDIYWKQWSHNSSEWAMRVNQFYKSSLWNVIEGHVGTSKCEAIFGRFEDLLKSSLENLSHWDSYWAYPWSSYVVLQVLKET